MPIEYALEHMRFLAQCLKKDKPQSAVVAILLELNISTNTMGFEYLKRAVMLCYEDPMQLITKEIYQKVADSCREPTSIAQVEQTIRRAINQAWKRENKDAFFRYFSREGSGILKKPTNAEFISRIVRIVELWEGCFEQEADHE